MLDTICLRNPKKTIISRGNRIHHSAFPLTHNMQMRPQQKAHLMKYSVAFGLILHAQRNTVEVAMYTYITYVLLCLIK